MDKNYVVEGDRLIYRMPGELDHHSARMVSSQIDSMIEGKSIRKVVMDFQDTDFMDSSGIGVIIGRSRKLRFFNGCLTAVNMSDRVEKLFKTAGLHRIVEVRDNVVQ